MVSRVLLSKSTCPRTVFTTRGTSVFFAMDSTAVLGILISICFSISTLFPVFDSTVISTEDALSETVWLTSLFAVSADIDAVVLVVS